MKKSIIPGCFYSTRSKVKQKCVRSNLSVIQEQILLMLTFEFEFLRLSDHLQLVHASENVKQFGMRQLQFLKSSHNSYRLVGFIKDHPTILS